MVLNFNEYKKYNDTDEKIFTFKIKYIFGWKLKFTFD